MEELLPESLVGVRGDWEMVEGVLTVLGREDWFIVWLWQCLVERKGQQHLGR